MSAVPFASPLCFWRFCIFPIMRVGFYMFEIKVEFICSLGIDGAFTILD